MPITRAVPLGIDQMICSPCNGFGVRVYNGTSHTSSGYLETCMNCGGSGIRPNGPPLVDPELAATPKGHGID